MSWDPTPAQRGLLFAGLVALLAGTGIYLSVPEFGFGSAPPESPDSERPAQAAAGGGTGSPAPVGASSPEGSPEPGPSGPSPGGSAGPGGAAGTDPYTLLPVGEAEVGRAAEVATTFARRYTTYSHELDPQRYRQRLAELATDSFAQSLRGGSGGMAGRAEMRRDQVVATSEVQLEGIRLLTGSSINFVVAARQTVESAGGSGSGSGAGTGVGPGGSRTDTTRYDVTVIQSGSGWKVSNLTLASQGDAGASP